MVSMFAFEKSELTDKEKDERFSRAHTYGPVYRKSFDLLFNLFATNTSDNATEFGNNDFRSAIQLSEIACVTRILCLCSRLR